MAQQTNPETTTPAAPAAPATATPATPAAAPSAARKRVRRAVAKATVHVKATFNNTLITITDQNGDVLVCLSAGNVGFKGSKKGMPFAAQRASEECAIRARKMGITEVEVLVNGPGSGRESAVTALQAAGLRVTSIEDVTPLPHNGCRPRKKRRV